MYVNIQNPKHAEQRSLHCIILDFFKDLYNIDLSSDFVHMVICVLNIHLYFNFTSKLVFVTRSGAFISPL